jgi:parallel beta-helix repeat protein
MVDFQAWDMTSHPIVRLENDYNNILAHGLTKPYSFLVRINGSYFECIKGDGTTAGTISYGGVDNAGGVDGTDADAVLQAALTNVSGTELERIVVVGDFSSVGATLTMGGYTVLDLRQAELTLANSVDDHLLEVSANSDYWWIMGGWLHGNSANNAAGAGLRINNGCHRFWVEDLHITDCQSHGIHVEGTTDIGVGTFRHLDLEDNTGSGMLLGPWTSDMAVDSCNFGGNTLNGLSLSASSGNVICNCLAWNNALDGFDCFAGFDNVFTNCRSDQNSQRGFHFGGSATRYIVANCHLFQNTWEGVFCETVTLINITGNYLRFNSYDGIDLNSSSFCVVANNTIQQAGYHGIVLTGASQNIILGNNVFDSSNAAGSTYDNIQVDTNSVRNVISSNQLYDVSGQVAYGLDIHAGSNYNVVKSNVYYNHQTGEVNNLGSYNSFDRHVMAGSSLDLSGAGTDVLVYHADTAAILCGYSLL